ncbi:MAG: phytanoyl-CoA dioxygenase family protein [Acidimicrobiales bacterium]|nr:phytanoyl-CoA dioxygenase family protein [Acidimicrobiales bacterium]
MSIDVRTRVASTVRSLSGDEIFDTVLPDGRDQNGPLAARGARFLELPALGLDVDGRTLTLEATEHDLLLRPGLDAAGIVAVLPAEALSDLLQDRASAIGLAMQERVKITAGSISHWVRWEPVLRALLDGRKVHEPGDVTFVDRDGGPLPLDRRFTMDDDRDEMAHFLEEAGFLHVRGVFEPPEMSTLSADIDEWIGRATPDDGASWWASDVDGNAQAVRVLFFHEKSEVLPSLLSDPRFTWIGDLTGDGHRPTGTAEGLVKPLGIVRGLSDLPWHKDCGQGGHSYTCSNLTCGISATGADRSSGALGVVPGSHRANTTASGLDPRLALDPILLETEVGDVTVHCSDTLHRAHPPVERTRKVVYSGFTLPPLEPVAAADPATLRAARARLSDVQSRIEAADNEESPRRYRAGLGR